MALPNTEKLTSQLSMMTDDALKRMAIMYKQDPYVLPLVISEDGRRKQLRTASAGQVQAQPKVNEQDIAQMSSVDPMGNYVGAPLPETVGIGALPAKNLQRMAVGGIVAFEEGGEVPSFRSGGMDDDIFNTAFLRTLKYEGGRTNDTGGDTKYGISKKSNPDVDIDKLTVEGARKLYKERYWNAISGDKLAAINPTLAQIAFDTAVNQSPAKAKQFVTESGGDPAKYMQLRGEHYAGLIEKNPNKYGAYAKGWMNRLGNLATDLAIPSARAEEAPGQAAPQAQGSANQPLVSPESRAKYGLKEKLLGSYPNIKDITLSDVGRNINNTLNALGGWTAPANTVNRAVGVASRELAPTAEAVAEAARLKQVATTPRIVLAKPGLEGLDEAAQATRAAAEQARQARILAGDVEAARKAEQGVKAAELTSNTARTTEEALAAQQNARAIQSAKVANVGKANAALGGVEDLLRPPAKISLGSDYGEADDRSFGEIDRTGAKKEGSETAVAGPQKKGGFSDEDLMTLGLNLMANKTPGTGNTLSDLVGAIGQAGLGTIAAKQEREKQASEKLYREAMAKHYGVDPLLQRLEALKDPKTAEMFQKMKELERDPMTKEKLYTAFMSSPLAMSLMNEPDKLNAAFKNYLNTYEQNLGSLGTTPSGATASQLAYLKQYG